MTLNKQTYIEIFEELGLLYVVSVGQVYAHKNQKVLIVCIFNRSTGELALGLPST